MAYVRKYQFRASKAPRRMRKPMAKRARKRPVSFAKKVQSVIKSVAETKSIQYFNSNEAVSDYKTGSLGIAVNTMTIVPLSPDSGFTPIPVGTTQSSRIGNQIMISKVTLRGMINPRTYTITGTSNNAPAPFLLKMWIGYQRDTAYCKVDQTLPNFLQSGGTSSAPDGTLMDTFRKVNTDKYVIVATRTFKVGPSVIVTTQDTPNAPNNQNYANNDFKFCQRFLFDVTKHVIKKVKYNDTNNQPNCRGLYWWFEAIDITGANFASGRYPAEISYEVNIQYKDI